jgi:hypothetical protein
MQKIFLTLTFSLLSMFAFAHTEANSAAHVEEAAQEAAAHTDETAEEAAKKAEAAK